MFFFVQPACSERDVIVTTSVQGVFACVHCAGVHPSGFAGTITFTFVHGFQNNLTQLFIRNNHSG